MTLLGFCTEDVLLIDLVVDDEDEDGVRRRCWMRGSSPEYVEDISPHCVNASFIQSDSEVGSQINQQVTRKRTLFVYLLQL